jgi:myo-inositol-1(or 4)-monophosphatase
MPPDLPAQLAALREIVLRAGGELLDRLGDAGLVEAKAGTEFVTAMDRRAEEILLAGLDADFPADAVRTEESDGHGGISGRTWHVDPLDGTTNYAHGHPFFAVSAACADQTAGLVLGAVYAPYLDELYLAARGAGAVLERPGHGTRTLLEPRAGRPLAEALVATGFPYVRDGLVDRNTNLVRDFLKAPCHGVRRAGSAAIDLCHVAAGKLDGYWEFRLRSWDTAAGTLVAREAGVHVTGVDGAEQPLHWEHILAAPPGLHAEMAAVLATAGEPA